MGVTIGYYYNCGKCGQRLDNDVIFLIEKFNPIRFGYLVEHCDNCGTLYSTHNNEFFTVGKKDFRISLIFSMIRWLILFFIIIACIFEETAKNYYFYIFAMLFIPFYYFTFKWRWKSGIKTSMKRLNDASYIYDLIQFNYLNFDMINMFYEHRVISEETYRDLLFMITSNHEKAKEEKKKDNLISSLVDNFRTTKTKIIKCQVCDKEIPYNEYGTCESCHKEIMKRLEAKNKE